MAEDIPQSVVEAAVAARVPEGQRSVYVAEWFRDGLFDALREYERLGFRLVRDDEATVERMADAIYRTVEAGWPWEEAVRAAFTAAQGGEGNGS